MAPLLAELRKLVTPELTSELSHHTQEPEAAVSRAYDAAMPALAATIANRSSDRGFMNQLVDLATSASADPDLVNRAMRLASSPAVDTASAAGGWISSLFGENLSGVTRNLARYAGIRESSASSLLMTCAPLVLGFIGRLMRTDNLSAAGLAERLQREQSQIAAALPAGFEIPGIVRQPYEAARAMADDAPEPARRRFAVPIAAALAAVGMAALLWWAKEPAPRPEPAQARVETTLPKAVGTAGTVDLTHLRTMPDRSGLAFPAGSSEDRLASYLASAGTGSMNIRLDRAVFETGSARLTPESKQQVGNIAAILREHPNATVAIAGHTDNVGSEPANLALSRARAEMIAWELRNAGVAAARIHVEAFGAQKPVADNATESGRAQNRRVTLDVTR